jgi:hypothetical protein
MNDLTSQARKHDDEIGGNAIVQAVDDKLLVGIGKPAAFE